MRGEGRQGWFAGNGAITRAVFLLLCLLGLSLGPVSALAHQVPERAALALAPSVKAPPADASADKGIVDEKKQILVLLVDEDTDGGGITPQDARLGGLPAPTCTEQFNRSGERPLLSVGAPRGPPLRS